MTVPGDVADTHDIDSTAVVGLRSGGPAMGREDRPPCGWVRSRVWAAGGVRRADGGVRKAEGLAVAAGGAAEAGRAWSLPLSRPW
jgi:hypothetical protein